MKNQEKNPVGDNSQFDTETFDENSDIVAKREGEDDNGGKYLDDLINAGA